MTSVPLLPLPFRDEISHCIKAIARPVTRRFRPDIVFDIGISKGIKIDEITGILVERFNLGDNVIAGATLVACELARAFVGQIMNNKGISDPPNSTTPSVTS